MAREACPGPEFLSIRRNGAPAFASQRARTSPVGPAPTIRTCGWLTTFAPRFTGRYRSVIVGEAACSAKGDRTAVDDHSLELYVRPGEVDKDSAQRPGIAAAFG